MANATMEAVRGALGDLIDRDEVVRGDLRVWVTTENWRPAAEALHGKLGLRHFIDLTAVDYIERSPEADRFDLVVMARSQETGMRVELFTTVPEDGAVASLCSVWSGANWAEREVWDMFGIQFSDHPDMRRILLYEQFEGHPLRKDYPIERAQPLVPYREEEGLDKLAPFGADEGQPFGRIDWRNRNAGRDQQVSPTLAVQSAQLRNISDSEAAAMLLAKVKRASEAQTTEDADKA